VIDEHMIDPKLEHTVVPEPERMVDPEPELTADVVMSSYPDPPVYVGGNPLIDRLRLENDVMLPSSSVASTRE